MEGFFLLKEMRLPGDLMCKIDLKDPYFFANALVCLQLQEYYEIYENSNCSHEKTLHQDHNLLRQYAFDRSHPKGVFNGLGTLIYLLQSLGFLINIQISVFNPTLTLEFLGVVKNSQDMTLIPPKEKILKTQKYCEEILSQPLTSIRTLSKLIGRLTSTAAVILPAPLQHKPLQHDQIHGTLPKSSLEEKVTPSGQARRELDWWIQNLNP